MRFSITGQGQQRIPLETYDKSEAEALAHVKWHETNALDNAGLSVTFKRFADIAEEFINELEFDVKRDHKQEYHLRPFPPCIRRYFVGFFDNRMLSAITAEDIESYWTTEPA